jgi:phosphatidylserine/phosphatidylglycerophosphate/cardiolipin synthase-like enzyme
MRWGAPRGAGVEVRVMYDYRRLPRHAAEFFDRMRAQGVHLSRTTVPVLAAALLGADARNHRKTLVCDGRVAFDGRPQHRQRMGQPSRRAAATGTTRSSRSRGPRSRPSTRRSSCAPGTGARRSGRGWIPPALRRRRPPADAAGRHLEQRDGRALRHPAAALHAIRESRARIYPGEPVFRARSCVLRRACSGAGARGVDVAAAAAEESDSTRARPGVARRVAAAARRRRAHLASSAVRPSPRSCRSTTVFVSDRQLQLRPPLAAYNLEMVVNVLRTRAYGPIVVAMLESDMPASEELTRDSISATEPMVWR